MNYRMTFQREMQAAQEKQKKEEEERIAEALKQRKNLRENAIKSFKEALHSKRINEFPEEEPKELYVLRPTGQDWFVANNIQNSKQSNPSLTNTYHPPTEAWINSPKKVEQKTLKQLPPIENTSKINANSNATYSTTVESLVSAHLLPPIQKNKPLLKALTDRPELFYNHNKLKSLSNPPIIQNPITLARRIEYVAPAPLSNIPNNQVQVFEVKTVPKSTIINSPERAQSPTAPSSRKVHAPTEISLEEAKLLQSLQRLENICNKQKEKILDLHKKSEHLEQEVTSIVEKSNQKKEKTKQKKAFPIPSIALNNGPNGLPQPRTRNRIKHSDSPVNNTPHPAYGRVLMGEDKEEPSQIPKRIPRKRWEGTNTFIPKTTEDVFPEEEPLKRWFIPLKSKPEDIIYERSPIQRFNDNIMYEETPEDKPTPTNGGIILGEKAANFLYD